MKKLLVLTIALVFSSELFAANSNMQNFAFVDLQLAMETVKAGTRAKERLEKEFKEKQKMLKAREEQIRKLSTGFETKKLVMSDSKKMKKQQEIQKKMMEYRELLNQSQTSMQKRQMELTKPIVNSMRSVIQEIADKEKIDFVYEKNQGGILFAKNAKNITNLVVKRYNEIHK